MTGTSCRLVGVRSVLALLLVLCSSPALKDDLDSPGGVASVVVTETSRPQHDDLKLQLCSSLYTTIDITIIVPLTPPVTSALSMSTLSQYLLLLRL